MKHTHDSSQLEKQLTDLGKGIHQYPLHSTQSRVESLLRAHWNNPSSYTSNVKEHPMSSQQRFTPFKKYLVFGFGGIAVIALALITTIQTKTSTVADFPTTVSSDSSSFASSSSSSSMMNADNLDVSLGSEDSGDSGFFNRGKKTEVASNEYQESEAYRPSHMASPQPTSPPGSPTGTLSSDLSYTEDGKEKQLFQEDISFKIETDTNIVDVLDAIRGTLNDIDGYLVSTQYYQYGSGYSQTGLIDVKIPTDHVTDFQEFLKSQDNNQELEVLSYNVQNVSNQITGLDNSIQQSQELLDQYKDQLDDLDDVQQDYQRTNLQNQIDQQQQIIEHYKQQQEEIKTTYSFTNVRISVSRPQSFWEGGYTQDRSTTWGEIKYQFGKAVHSLIDNLSDLIIFIVWVAVYAVIFVPLGLLIRKIARVIQKKKSNTDQ